MNIIDKLLDRIFKMPEPIDGSPVEYGKYYDTYGVTAEGLLLKVHLIAEEGYYVDEDEKYQRVEPGTTVQTKDGIWKRTLGVSERVLKHNPILDYTD